MKWEVKETGGMPQKLGNVYYQKPDGLKSPELADASERIFNYTLLLKFLVKKMLLQMISNHHEKTA